MGSREVLRSADRPSIQHHFWGLALAWAAVLTAGLLLLVQSGVRPAPVHAHALAEPEVHFAVSQQAATEAAGTVFLTLTLKPTSTVPVTLTVTSEDGTAVAPDDYTPVKQRVVIPAGQSQFSVPLTLIGDSVREGDETLVVFLSNPILVRLGEISAVTLTILDDDSFLLDATGATAAEGEGALAFVVTLDSANTLTTFVDYRTEDGSAGAPGDYLAQAGTLVLPPATTQATVTVPLVDDSLAEPSETFWLVLENPVNAALRVERAEGRILDNEPSGPMRLFVPAVAR